VVNRYGVNKLSQLSISVSFILRTTYLGSVFVYVTQGFRTVNWACLSYSPISLVSRNMSKAAKPQWNMNVFRFSAAISAHRQWVVDFMYDISSPMRCHVLRLATWLYTCVFSKHLYFFARWSLLCFLMCFVLFSFYT
jgi:hypothetical protein